MNLRTNLIAIAGIAIALTGCSESKYASAVVVEARPGSVALVSYDQPVLGDPPAVFGWLEAHPSTEPDVLPQGAKVLHASMALHSSGDISGDLLVHVPAGAKGEIEFTLKAWSLGQGITTGATGRFTSREVPVSIHVTGPPADVPEPELHGQWRSANGTWTFDGSGEPLLHIEKEDGDESWMRYRLYPDLGGRWFLVSMSHTDTAYWIAVDDSRLYVDWPGTEFSPFSEFERL